MTMRVVVLCLLLACGMERAHAGGLLTIVTVGVGPSCDFNSLQDAINSGSTAPQDRTEIWMSADMTTVGLIVLNRNLTIRGNFASCNGFAPSPARRAIIGGLTNSVIRALVTDASDRTLTLRDVIVRDGGTDNASERGGGVHVQNRVALTLDAVSISRNVSVRGGGIAVVGNLASATIGGGSIIGADPDANLNGNGSTPFGVEQGLGGGIYCEDGALTLTNAYVRSNTSALHGAGIYADNCSVAIEPDPAPINPNRFVLSGNVAFNGNGGGIYATGGTTIFWRTVPVGSYAGVAVTNIAAGSGGALFLTGASSFVGDFVRFVDSRADVRGGAIAAEDASNVILRGVEGLQCLSWLNCPGIIDSRGVIVGENATLIGGAIHATGGAQVSLSQQHLYNNAANNGSALHVNGSATRATLNSVLIARSLLYGVGNGTSTIELTSSADATLRHVTMATNFRASDQFPLIEPALSSIRANGNQSEVELRNSSFYNDADSVIRLLVSASVSGSCVLAHENVSFPAATVLNPQYNDTTGDFPDFRLALSSPARDRCAASGPVIDDVLGRRRPLDLFDVSNGPGPSDAGAFEAFGDELLSDGFELSLR